MGVDDKYAMQHRWVMEQHLGRPLLHTEEVHHRNGDRADNRIENLTLEASHRGHLHLHRARWLCRWCGAVFEAPPKYHRSFCSRGCFYAARTGEPLNVRFPPAKRAS